MNVAFVMDPMEFIKAHKDTTFFLMLGAQKLGHQVFHLMQSDLFADNGRVFARVTRVQVLGEGQPHFRVIGDQTMPLEDMDVVMIRPDPPFDRRYFYTTLLLDLLPSSVLVVNRPQTLRDWNEKLAALKFPDLGPRTMIASDPDTVIGFMDAIGGRITLKPVDGYGGRGIFFLHPDDPNRDQILGMLTGGGRRWIVAQEYLPAAREGDKRILLLDGEPLGAVLRVHPPDKEINNLDAGGKAYPVELSKRDLDICHRLKPELTKNGLIFVGIDVIGDHLVEINVTSPTGLREMAEFMDEPLNETVMLHLEALAGRC